MKTILVKIMSLLSNRKPMLSRALLTAITAGLCLSHHGIAQPQDAPQQPPRQPQRSALQIDRDLEYGRPNGRSLTLDLYRREPADAPSPVVVWLNSGLWTPGEKYPTPAAALTTSGYAVASIEYRAGSDAPFPAQVHDAKAAIRWLRANSAKYNLDNSHIGVWGFGSGGNLAALLGTSGGVEELEGDSGNPDQSSRVQAVVDCAGFVDLLRMDPTGTKPRSTDNNLGHPLFENMENMGHPLLSN